MLRKSPEGRPSIERVVTVFRNVLANPAANVRPVIAGIQQAAAAETELRNRVDAEEAAAREVIQRRQQLAADGVAAFGELSGQLARVIHEAEPSIRVVASAQNFTAELGRAGLMLRLTRSEPLSADSMPNSKWDVVLSGWVKVTQSTSEVLEHSASLWYARLPRTPQYRWYEVSYAGHPLIENRPSRGELAAEHIGDADLAATGGMHTVVIEFGPEPIDGEDFNQFVERWLARFLEAYHGRLRPL